MYEFHCKYIKGNIMLLFTDRQTGSLLYETETYVYEDFYKEFVSFYDYLRDSKFDLVKRSLTK